MVIAARIRPLFILVLAICATMPACASAQLTLTSFSDGVTMSKSDLASFATQLRSGCVRKPGAVKALTLSAALADLNAQLARNSSAKARRAFASSSAARTAANAGTAVFGALADSRPWAAVDAALRMQALDPKDADPLISLAGLADSQRLPQDALAFLTAAAKLPAKASAPMGISVKAVAANNKGLALLLLGAPKQAIPYLQSAAKTAPELAEARLNLDAAQQCNYVLLPGGSRPSQPPVIADPPLARDTQSIDWTTDDNGDPVPVASSYLDLSQTEDWTPVTFQFPDNPQMGGQSQDYFTALKSQIENQIVTNSTKEGQLGAQVRNPESRNPAAPQRRLGGAQHRCLAATAALALRELRFAARRAWGGHQHRHGRRERWQPRPVAADVRRATAVRQRA